MGLTCGPRTRRVRGRVLLRGRVRGWVGSGRVGSIGIRRFVCGILMLVSENRQHG